MLLCLMLSHRPLMLSSFFFNSFFFLIFQLGDFHYPVFLIAGPFFCAIRFAVDSLQWFFSFQLLRSSVVLCHILECLGLCSSCWSSDWVPSFFCTVEWASSWLLLWTLHLVDSWPQFHVVLFLGFYPVFCLEHILFYLHFACLFLCIILGRQVKSLGLEKVALFSCGALISMSPLSPEPGGLEGGPV